MNALCKLASQYGPLAGRILLALIFVMAGWNKIGGFEQTAGYMASKGLPMANILLTLTIIIELGAGLMVLLGMYARWGAAALFGFTLLATLIFHNFWAIADAQQAYIQSLMFMKNLAIMGGLLYVVAYGSGAFSIKKENC
ncbi:MAG: DoxX family protein [Gammaproteobacteria bacterium]|nr:MAG: DoxX family protein [Gammaproteobacteria bacterium]